MTPRQTALVQASFATLAPRAEEVAVLFDQRLFASILTCASSFLPRWPRSAAS